jgi:hypothetical protein
MKTFFIATLLTLIAFNANAQVYGHGASYTSGGPNYAPPTASNTNQQGNSNGHVESINTGSSSSNVSSADSEWTLVIVTGTKAMKNFMPSIENLTVTKMPGYAFHETCNRSAVQAKQGKFTMDAYCIQSPF